MSVPGANRNYSTDSVLIAVFSTAALLVHLLTNGRYGYFRDELYYIACARHLAFGYVDQPPLSILLLLLSQLLLGDSLFAIRLLPALAGAAIVALTDNRARDRRTRMGNCSRLRGIALRAVQSGSWKFLFHERVRTAVLDGICLSGCANYQRRFTHALALVRRAVGNRRWKTNIRRCFSASAFLLDLAVSHTPAPPPRWKHLAGSMIAFAIALPNILWQTLHHWPTYELLRNIAHSNKNVALNPPQFIAQQAVFMNVGTLPLWLAGLFWLFGSRDGWRYRVIGIITCYQLAEFIVLHGKSYYLAPAYPMLFAAGGVAVERVFAARLNVDETGVPRRNHRNGRVMRAVGPANLAAR